MIENVPTRVNLETGEQLLSAAMVERLQEMVWEQRKPTRMIQVPMYDFSLSLLKPK